ncbi:MAG: molybdate ABC transporter permease subunit [Planctomycetota bacterium]|jgi:molybdate transport system permease protein
MIGLDLVAVWEPVRLSLLVACGCVAMTLVPGVLAGWMLARVHFPGKTVVDAIIHLPLVLPPVVVGYLLLLLLGRNGVIGKALHLDIAFTWQAAVIAASVMSFPLLVRSVRLAIELADERLEQAARVLGASGPRTFLTITLPLALPGVLTGAVLAFARSLGEFGATITFAGNVAGETRTLPLAVFSYSQSADGDATALALAGVAVALSLGALVASEVLARRIRARITP